MPVPLAVVGNNAMEGKTISSCRTSKFAPFITTRHALDLNLLRRRRDIVLTKPRDVNAVWDEFVVEMVSNSTNNANLPSTRSNGLKAAELKAFNDVVSKHHGNEDQFDKRLFLALRKCLTRHECVKACDDDHREPRQRSVPRADALHDEPNEGADESKRTKMSILKKIKLMGTSVLNAVSPGASQQREAKHASEPIVFHLPPRDGVEYPMYAIGLTRLINGEQGSSDIVGSGLAARSHCSCLLEKGERGGAWAVVRCFSVVELKHGAENECVNATIEESKVWDLQMDSADGAIAQALTDTVEWVLPSHASLGDRAGELKELSWAAIVGKKPIIASTIEGEEEESNADETTGGSHCDVGNEGTKSVPSMFRWMTGNIHVPEKCGDMFHYSVTGCGNLEVCEVISVYLDTLLFGLRAAKILLQAIRANITITPLPSSGRKVKFGKLELQDMKLQGKCYGGMRVKSDPDDNDNWKVSQGEIFTGKVNLSLLRKEQFWEDNSSGWAKFYLDTEVDSLSKAEQTLRALLSKRLTSGPRKHKLSSIIIFNEDEGDMDVVVKVCSLSVHNCLTPPFRTGVALRAIESAYLTPPSSRLGEANDADDNVESDASSGSKWDLFNVLVAAEMLHDGLIIIMADLSHDYKMLTPASDELSFHQLWSAFSDLVERILAPLADLDVIHPDLWPGWDVTWNILYSPSKVPAMQLIGFDSLVRYDHWNPPGYNHMYFRHVCNTAFQFLWWQSVTFAFAWYMQVDQTSMIHVNLQHILRNNGTHRFSKMLGKEFCACASMTNLGRPDFWNAWSHLSEILTSREDESE